MKLPRSYTTVTPLSKALAMLLFVALPFIGFYFGYKYANSVSVQPDYNNTPTSTKPLLLSNKSDDWKTYIDSEYGFSIEYPPVLNETAIGSNVKNDYLAYKTFETVTVTEENDDMGSYLKGSGLILNLEIKHNSCFNLEEGGQYNVGYKNYEKVNFLGFPAQKYQITWDSPRPNKQIDIDWAGRCLSVALRFGDEYSDGRGEALFDQILSTFKFLGQDAAVPLSTQVRNPNE